MPEIKLTVEPDRVIHATLELILVQLNKMEETIMATVQETNAKLDSVIVSVNEIAIDTAALLAEVEKLKTQGGASQVELDALHDKLVALDTKASAIAGAVPTP